MIDKVIIILMIKFVPAPAFQSFSLRVCHFDCQFVGERMSVFANVKA